MSEPLSPGPLPHLLAQLALRYEEERHGDRWGPFARSVLSLLPRAAREVAPHLTAKASVGQRSWATVPWLAMMDPSLTITVTRGVYLVALIAEGRVHLGLVHGAQDLCRTHGWPEGRAILRRRAASIRVTLADHVERFGDRIALGSPNDLPRAYEAAWVFGRSFETAGLDGPAFDADLDALLSAYADYTERTLPEAA